MVTFNQWCSRDNLYWAWRHFRRGKRDRSDTVAFERHLEDEIGSLSEELATGTYQHGPYTVLRISDPKPRVIHKASVRDRIVHQALFDVLYPEWNRRFYFDSYSSRRNKGTHAAIRRVQSFLCKASRNDTRDAWIAHLDVDDFFASVDQMMLLDRLRGRMNDERLFKVSAMIIQSFHKESGKGIPLGNLTSQLFANVYLHALDYVVKQMLHIRYYVRYNDDLFIVSHDEASLWRDAETIRNVSAEQLALSIPPEKRTVSRWSRGVDVLGAVLFPWGSVPRPRLRRAALRALAEDQSQSYNTDQWRRGVSYIGALDHTRSFLLQEYLRLGYAHIS